MKRMRSEKLHCAFCCGNKLKAIVVAQANKKNGKKKQHVALDEER